MNNSSAQP